MRGLIFVLMCLSLQPAYSKNNHLVPIRPFDDQYNRVVYESLIGEVNAELWMMTRDSFSPERAIILESEEVAEASNDKLNISLKLSKRKQSKRKWFLKEVQANQMIWLQGNNKKESTFSGFYVTKDVTIKRREIAYEKYRAVIKAWTAALKTTRYPEKYLPGLDGITYQFYARHNLYGETWSPQENIPFDLVQLGNILTRILHRPKNEEEGLLIWANQTAEKLLQEIGRSHQ